MDLPLSSEDCAFREEIRTFLAGAMPPDIRAKGAIMAECTREEVIRWFKILAAKGWIAPAWPREAGGAGWTMTRRLIFDIEANDAGAPRHGWGDREPIGPSYAVGLAPNFFDWRKMRIGGGGSDEISHEIIAKNVLRL